MKCTQFSYERAHNYGELDTFVASPAANLYAVNFISILVFSPLHSLFSSLDLLRWEIYFVIAKSRRAFML